MTRGVEVSVVLPAYNEEGRLADAVAATRDALGAFLPAGAYEVIVAEDGCTDRTPEIAADLAATHDDVTHFHADERLGRGTALERAFRTAEGDTLVYFDADLATDLSHLEELVESVRSGEYDVATGSRWLPDSDADRPASRGIPSYGFNLLVRFALRSSVRDHQCGFKAFDRDALFDVLEGVEDDHWFWDTEVLVRAQRAGYRVREFPVQWTPRDDSKVDVVRDVYGMGAQIVRTWWQLSVQPRITPRRSFAVGSALVLIAIVLMPFYIDPAAEVVEEIRTADPVLVALGGAVYLLSWPIRGLRYRDILAEIGHHETVGFLTGAIFVSQTGNLVFPARAGDAIRAYVVKARRGIPYTSGFASLATERVFDLLSIAALAGAVLLGLVATGSTGDIQRAISGSVSTDAAGSGQTALLVAAGVGVAAVLAVVAIVASARSERNYVRAVVTRLSSDAYADRVAGIVERFVGDVQTVTGDRRSFASVGATSLVIWSIDVIAAIFALAAFGVSIGFPSLIAVGFFAVSVGNLAKVLPLSPGGIGLYEGAFTLLVVALTPIGPITALAAAIVDHAVKNAVTVVGGLASMTWLNVSLTRAVEESKEVDVASGD